MGLRPGQTPGNFEQLKAVRSKTWFGSGGLCQCEKIARSTGKRCRQPAQKGWKVCASHGARKPKGAPVTPAEAQKRYLIQMALSDHARGVKTEWPWETSSAKGRAVHAALQKIK